MRFLARAIAPALLLAACVCGPAAAQIPGGSPSDGGGFRRSYLAEAYRAVDVVVVMWESAWLSSDTHTLAALYTDDAVYFPANARVSASGRGAVERALAGLLPSRKDLEMKMVDFSASGDMAYYAGHYVFKTDPDAGPVGAETGTFVLILQHSPRGWRIRSHVEKPDPAPSSAPPTAAAAQVDSTPPAPRS
ncbi:MAG: hypothetical protein JWM27_4516 [Gemmatimonadetes bacterium]|nr:hypothetical protein [Gemmatimonadota bacterium]